MPPTPAIIHSAPVQYPKLLVSPVRLPWVDVLRGVAVLLVLFRHIHIKAPQAGSGMFYRVLYVLQSGGGVGVDVFFVISGFLVSGILFRQYLRTGRIEPVQFLIRRGFKIYPAFWAMIFATLVWIWISRRQLPLVNALVELAFIQNYFSGLYTHTWSLGVEEQCYLGLCLVLTVLGWFARKNKSPFAMYPMFAVFAALGVFVIRSMDRSPITRDNFLQRVTPTHLRCDAFLVGTLLGYYYYFYQVQFQRVCQRFQVPAGVIGICCLVPMFIADMERASGYSQLWYCCAAPGAALLLMSALGTRQTLGWGGRVVATIGKHSYSIYLWHMLIGVVWLDLIYSRLRIPHSVVNWVPVYFAVSIVSGMVLTHLIETPALRLRDRWFPENGTSPSITAEGSGSGPAGCTLQSPHSLNREHERAAFNTSQ